VSIRARATRERHHLGSGRSVVVVRVILLVRVIARVRVLVLVLVRGNRS
jgi:hypothetical protein